MCDRNLQPYARTIQVQEAHSGVEARPLHTPAHTYSRNLTTTDTLAEQSKAVARGAIPKGRGFEPHRRHFCLLHQRNLTSRMGDRWGITERSHCLRGLMTSAQGARCPGFNAQRKPLFLTLSCLILFLGADHSEPPCPRSDKRWVVATCLA